MGKIGQTSRLGRPLASQDSTRRIFEIESEQESILTIVIGCVHIRAQLQIVNQDLSEGFCVHFLLKVATLKIIGSLRIFPLQKLLKGLQSEQSDSSVRRQRTISENSRHVALSFSHLSGGLLGHVDSVVYPRQLHLFLRVAFVVTHAQSIVKLECLVILSDPIFRVHQVLIRGLHLRFVLFGASLSVSIIFVIFEFVGKVSSYHRMFNCQFLHHGVKSSHKSFSLFFLLCGLCKTTLSMGSISAPSQMASISAINRIFHLLTVLVTVQTSTISVVFVSSLVSRVIFHDNLTAFSWEDPVAILTLTSHQIILVVLLNLVDDGREDSADIGRSRFHVGHHAPKLLEVPVLGPIVLTFEPLLPNLHLNVLLARFHRVTRRLGRTCASTRCRIPRGFFT